MVTYSLEGEVMDKEREDAEKLMLKEVSDCIFVCPVLHCICNYY